VVYLPQTLPAGVHLHVLESIIVARHAAGGVRSDSEAEVMSLLRQLGIAHLALSYLDQLSGGQNSSSAWPSRLSASRHYSCWMNRSARWI
jgi:ABC-type cobalamin/Fe3+-siderophores transport system ATPase subunit